MGVIRGSMEFIRDVTRRVRADVQPLTLPPQLAQVVEQVPACLAILDTDMRYLAVSRRLLAELGALLPTRSASPVEVIGRRHHEIFPGPAPRWREINARMLAGEAVAEQEELVTRADGTTVRMRWSVKPWHAASGRVGGALLFCELVTEQPAAQRARAETETLFRATFENDGVGIAHFGSDLRWLRANDALCRILGWPRDELLTKSIRDISHPDDFTTDASHLKRLLAGEIDSYGMDKRYLRKDGTVVWGRLTVGCVRREDGSIAFYISIIEDISARKHAEELLKHHADLLAHSYDAIFEFRSDGRRIVYWNRGAERLYGYTAAEAVGRRADELLNTRAAVAIEDIDAQVVRAGSWSGELNHRTRDGRDIVVETRIVPVSHGGEMFALETNRDITDRKRAEDALRDSEERLRAIYDGTYEYIGLLSPDGTLLDANRASLEFTGGGFGSRREHVIGRPAWETPWFRHTPGAPEELRRAIKRAAAGEFIRSEIPLIRPSGETVMFDFSLHPVRNAQGEVFLLVPEGRIITDRKRAEEELARSEERFRTSILRSPLPTILFNEGEEVIAISHSWLTAAGAASAADFPRMADVLGYLFGNRSGEVLELVRRIIATEPEAHTNEQVLTLAGKRRIWSFVTSSLGLQSDGRRLFVCVAQDKTEQRAYEERIGLLMREARHRIKNVLGIVQAIARQTATTVGHDLVDRFNQRIHALAANQDLLVRHEWQGIRVNDLVQSQLGHFADVIGSRVVFDGPPLPLNAAAAQAIGLALHELATNAAKYGALSNDAGRVDVSWRLNRDAFVMAWCERGGPPVSPPQQYGFGTTVIKTMVQHTLGGTVRLDHAPAGLEWHLTCRAADALERPVDHHAFPQPQSQPEPPAAGTRPVRNPDGSRSAEFRPGKALTSAGMLRTPAEYLDVLRAAIGAEQRMLFSDLLTEPLPPDIAELLRRLDAAPGDGPDTDDT